MPFSNGRLPAKNTKSDTAFPPFLPHNDIGQSNTLPPFPYIPLFSAAVAVFSAACPTIRRIPRHKGHPPAALPVPDIPPAARPAARNLPAHLPSPDEFLFLQAFAADLLPAYLPVSAFPFPSLPPCGHALPESPAYPHSPVYRPLRADKDTCTPAETATVHRYAMQSGRSDSFPPKENKVSAFRTLGHVPAPIIHREKRKAGTHSNKPPPMLPPAPLASLSCNPYMHVPNIHTTVGVFSKFSDTALSSSQFHSSYFTSCL